MSFLERYMKNASKIGSDKIQNQYDTSSNCTQMEEEDELVKSMYKSSSPLSKYIGSSTPRQPSIDNLQAPRNQMQYYTNQLNKLGVEPEKPSALAKAGSAVLKGVEAVSAIPNSIENAIASFVDKYNQINDPVKVKQ
ncbi:MAG: hypothetical protein ACRC42_01565 [Mycoplasma sp.]